jgi:hypothetical protein
MTHLQEQLRWAICSRRGRYQGKDVQLCERIKRLIQKGERLWSS